MFIYACFYKLCRKFYATFYEIGQEKFAPDFYPCKISLLNFISKILAEKVGPQHRQCSWCFGNMICCKNITMNRFQQWPLGNMRCCKPCSSPPLLPTRLERSSSPSLCGNMSVHILHVVRLNAHVNSVRSYFAGRTNQCTRQRFTSTFRTFVRLNVNVAKSNCTGMNQVQSKCIY